MEDRSEIKMLDDSARENFGFRGYDPEAVAFVLELG
jgi:hypothetical protein